MSTLHLNIELKLGRTYLDEKGHKVTLVREFTPEDPDYVQGFRFRGDNKINYLANGEVVGSLGDFIHVKQLGAYPLKNEVIETTDETVILKDVGLLLKEGKFYRNGLGHAVLIIGAPVVDGRWWKKGFRFMDQRGTFYKPNGSVDSRIWGILDIVMEITPESPLKEQVSDEEMETIMGGINTQLERMNRRDALNPNTLLHKAAVFSKKSLKGLGVAYAAIGTGAITRSPKFGLFCWTVAGATFATDALTGDVTDWE
jgi:hypothetical protein